MNFEHHIHQGLKVKISGWLCLEHLDFTATVIFCSFETLQNIHFQAMEQDVQKRVRRCFLAGIP